MVIILGYNNTESQIVNSILDKNNISYKYSLLESQILDADKLILPNPENFNSAYRRVNMMNLFSMLKIIDKPILGIDNAIYFMCSQILDKFKCGLGLFDFDLNFKGKQEIEELYVKGKVDVQDDSKLVKISEKGSTIWFNEAKQYPLSEYSKSSVLNQIGRRTSITYEKGNSYAVTIDFEKNPDFAKRAIENFLNL